jgi:hypothetical protein
VSARSERSAAPFGGYTPAAPVRDFLSTEAAGAAIMLGATAIALG